MFCYITTMKLYLSSYYFGKNVDRLFDLVSGDKSVAIILNAGDASGDEKREAYFKAEKVKFEQRGYETEELDLRKYFADNSTLKTTLEQYGLIWVMGGNSFVLRRALRQSGADEILVNLVQQNKLVYSGFSAGAVVASPTLHGIELVDDLTVVPEGYNDEVVWEGMGFVDYSIAPHFKSYHPESKLINSVVEYFEKRDMPFNTLSDGEDIIVDTPTS